MPTPNDPPDERFEPRAAEAMARMFDRVTDRYDLLNSLMSLGQDAAWRAALADAVPAEARVVLDLCTGTGVSLTGLRRPGRLVLGADVSLGMLQLAREDLPEQGWAPRLLCADAFRLPLPDGSVDAVTIAFGIRNLRPRPAALAEIRRVLSPGGTLAVLEATAPRPGAIGAFHGFHLRHLVPLLGRLSPDPSAYRYLAASVFEFGDGAAFERDLAAAGFGIDGRRRFLLGATSLWATHAPREAAAARPSERSGEIPNLPVATLQSARRRRADRADSPHSAAAWEREWRSWVGVQVLLSAALTVALAWGIVEFVKFRPGIPLERWQERGLWFLLIVGLAAFFSRTVVLAVRLSGPARRR